LRKYRRSFLKSKNGLALLVVFSLGLVVALILFLISRAKKKNPETWIRKTLGLAGVGVKEIDLWVAVSKTETDNYQSDLCRKYYNCFGMGVATKRDTTRSSTVFMSGDNMYFSVYSNFEKSAQDLLLWIAYNGFNINMSDPDQFVTAMKTKGYFTASTDAYLKRLKSFL
jgi:hypothetical protein